MNLTPFKTHLRKEMHRWTSIWPQSILAPVMSTLLYILIFGVSLGSRIDVTGQFSYLDFILPGLVMLSLIQNSSVNSTFSIFLSKINGYIFDVLVAPLSYAELVAGYMVSSTIRGFVVGVITYFIGYLFSGLIPVNLGIVFLISFLTSMCFAAIGAIIAIFAKDFDSLGIFQSFILTPLIYLGGVFYSIEILPPFWQSVSKYNPLLYMIDALRYGFLGTSDINIVHSTVFITALTIFFTGMLLFVMKKGYKLRA